MRRYYTIGADPLLHFLRCSFFGPETVCSISRPTVDEIENSTWKFYKKKPKNVAVCQECEEMKR